MTKNIKVNLTKDQAKNIFYQLFLSRRFEEVVAQFYRSGKIAGFCHLYIGQEAVVTGINFHMSKKDSVITGYRDHVHALMYGGDPKSVLAELCGKKQGMMGGKGGSMHFFNYEHNFYGGQAIVGTTVPLGAGVALAHKYRKDSGICVAYIGDGAILQGQVAEALNMSSLWKLPILVVVENNQYAMGTSVKRSHANKDISSIGAAYNIKTIKVNGMDVLDVICKSKEAFNYTRNGKGPILLDVNTYRYRGHSMSDPAKYRDRAEVDYYRENNDPIVNFTKYVSSVKLLLDNEIKEMKDCVESSLKELSYYIDNTQEPDLEELYDNIYA